MPLGECLQVLAAVRREQVVVSTMSPAREWMNLGTHPLDFIYAPSSMGQAPAVGLGIALAQPERQIIVCNGDGCMLMNLGSLVTITAEAPGNFVLAVFDNSVYEVTGMQQTAGSAAARARDDGIDFCGVARACGFRSVFSFEELGDWQAGVQDVLAAAGPTFVLLKVEPVPGALVPKSPSPPRDRAAAFARALTDSSS